jgi:hypothetical protein
MAPIAIRFAAAAGVAALLCATGAAALPFGPKGPKSVELAPDNVADTVGHFTPTAVASLKGVHRVVVPQFQVEYVTRSQGLTRKERNQVTVVYGYKPPSDAALQAATDKLHDRFVAQLQAAGFEVVPREAMEGAAAWQKLAAGGKPSGVEFKSESGSGRLFVGGARPYYFYPGDQHLGTSAIGWGFTQAHMSEQALGTELNAAVVSVRLVVGIRETDRHSQMLALVRTASSFIGDPRIEIEAPASALFVAVPGKTGGMMSPAGRATFAVKDDLLFQEDLMSATLKDTGGAASTASNAVSSAMFAGAILANMAGGGIGMKLYKSYKFEAEPPEADYLAALDRNGGGVADAMVAQLKAAAQ